MILDFVQNKSAKEGIPKRKETPIKGKDDFKTIMAEEEAIIEKLVESNQILTIVNKLIEPLTISTDNVKSIELPKESILLTGFKFIDSWSCICQMCFLYWRVQIA